MGNATDFGDLTVARRLVVEGCSSSTRGLFGGGTASNPGAFTINTIEFVTIATTANATDFGDLNTQQEEILVVFQIKLVDYLQVVAIIQWHKCTLIFHHCNIRKCNRFW